MFFDVGMRFPNVLEFKNVISGCFSMQKVTSSTKAHKTPEFPGTYLRRRQLPFLLLLKLIQKCTVNSKYLVQDTQNEQVTIHSLCTHCLLAP
jgi:hypothetical protein